MLQQEVGPLAETLLRQMAPYCERIAIANQLESGAGRAEVGVAAVRVAIVAIPKWEERPSLGSLYAPTMERVNLLHEWAVRRARVTWLKPGVEAPIPWTPGPHGPCWRGVLPATGLSFELRLTTPEKWMEQAS